MKVAADLSQATRNNPASVGRSRSLAAVRFGVDAAAVLTATVVALALRFATDVPGLAEAARSTRGAHLVAATLWVIATLGALAVNRLYDEDTLFVGGGELSRVVRAVVEATAVFAVFVFLTQSFYVSRAWFGFTVLGSAALLMIARLALRRRVARRRAAGRERRPVILVSKHLDPSFGAFVGTSDEFDVVGHLDPASLHDHFVSSGGRGGPALLIDVGDFHEDELWRIVVDAGGRGYPVFIHAAVRSVQRDRLTVRDVGGQTIVKVGPPALDGYRARLKRAFDVAGAIAIAIAAAPILAAIAAAVLVTSGRPILFRQERVGLGGKPFSMLKFRTMRPDAERDTGAVWATENDPRRTPLGRLLRKTSLDELPQLWNVVVGDMSLVGPRPERPVFVGEFTDRLEWYRYRHRIRPGMTGWAQAHGLRGDTSLTSRVEFDNWYIENWSIGLDLSIMVRTLAEVFRGENAY